MRTKPHEIISNTPHRLQLILQSQIHLLQPPNPLACLPIHPPRLLQLRLHLILPLLLDGDGTLEDLVFVVELRASRGERGYRGEGGIVFGLEAG